MYMINYIVEVVIVIFYVPTTVQYFSFKNGVVSKCN